MYGRRDNNQRDIKQALEQVGIRVWDAADMRNGFPDLVAGGIHRETMQPMIVLLEVKADDKATLTPDELRFHTEWEGLPVFIVRSEAQALKLFGVE